MNLHDNPLWNSDNPICYRERRAALRRAARQRWWFTRVPVTVLVWSLPALIFAAVGLGSGGAGHLGAVLGTAALMSMYLQIFYLCFKGLVAGAGAVAREREQQTLDVLLSSPMPVDRFMAGKFWAAATPLLTECLLAFPFSLSVIGAGESLGRGCPARAMWVVPEVLLALSVGCVLVTVALGLVVSARAASVTRATSPAVMIGVLLYFGTYILGGLVSVAGNGPWAPCFVLLNPHAALISLQIFVSAGADRHALLFTWQYGWAITTGLYLVLWPAILAVAAWRFQRNARG